MGGTDVQVLGVATKPATIGRGAALMRAGDGSVTLDQGRSTEQAGVVVEVVSLSATRAVVTFPKA